MTESTGYLEDQQRARIEVTVRSILACVAEILQEDQTLADLHASIRCIVSDAEVLEKQQARLYEVTR